MKRPFSLATFNVRGLTKEWKQTQLAEDIVKYNVDICCIQETKIVEGIDTDINKCRLISLSTENKYYGNGFIISSKWSENIHRYWKISDRISVIQLNLRNNAEDDEDTEKLNLKTMNNEVSL